MEQESDSEQSSSDAGVIEDDTDSSDTSTDQFLAHRLRRRQTTVTTAPVVTATTSVDNEVQPVDPHRQQEENFNALFREIKQNREKELKNAENRRQLRERETTKPKYESVEEAIEAQKLIRERHVMQKQQKLCEEEKRQAERERRRQENLMNVLTGSNRSPRPTVAELNDRIVRNQDEEDDDEADSDQSAEIGAHEEDGEHQQNRQARNRVVRERESGGENEVESEGSEGNESGAEENDDDEEDSDEDDSDEGSATLYTFMDDSVKWAKKKTFTYYKRLAGNMPPPRLKSLGASFKTVETWDHESRSMNEVEWPSFSHEERPSTSHEKRPSTSHAERPNICQEERSNISQGVRPSASHEERPKTSKKESPNSRHEQRASTSHEEKLSNYQEDRLNASQNEMPRTNNEDRFNLCQEKRPSRSPEERPAASFEERQSTNQDESPSTSYEERPSTSQMEKPVNRYEERPSTSPEDMPRTSFGERPGTSQEEGRSTNQAERLSVSNKVSPNSIRVERPSTGTNRNERPSTSREEKPSTSREEKPSTSREERQSTSREEMPSNINGEKPSTSQQVKRNTRYEGLGTSYENNPIAVSEPGRDKIRISLIDRRAVESNSAPSVPFWKQFSYVKRDVLEDMLQLKADHHPEPAVIRNSYSHSDKSTLDLSLHGDSKIRELNSSERIANMSNDEFQEFLELQAKMDKKSPPKRRLFGQVGATNDLDPIPESCAWQEEHSVWESIKEYQRMLYAQQPTTSKAADEAEKLKFAKKPIEQAENYQEHMAILAQQESGYIRDPVSPDEYPLAIAGYTCRLLDKAARKCELLKEPETNWTRHGPVDPHMQMFLDSIPDRPAPAYQSASSSAINTQNALRSSSSVGIGDDVSTPQAFLYSASESHISLGESVSTCNLLRKYRALSPRWRRGGNINPDKSDASDQSANRKSNANTTKPPAFTSQSAYPSLFLNPRTAEEEGFVSQPVDAGQFVFGQWKTTVINGNQSAAIQSGSAGFKLIDSFPKKRKKSEVDEDDADKNSQNPAKKKKRHQGEEDFNNTDKESQTDLKKSSATSRKRKRDDDSGNFENKDESGKKRKL